MSSYNVGVPTLISVAYVILCTQWNLGLHFFLKTSFMTPRFDINNFARPLKIKDMSFEQRFLYSKLPLQLPGRWHTRACQCCLLAGLPGLHRKRAWACGMGICQLEFVPAGGRPDLIIRFVQSSLSIGTTHPSASPSIVARDPKFGFAISNESNRIIHSSHRSSLSRYFHTQNTLQGERKEGTAWIIDLCPVLVQIYLDTPKNALGASVLSFE